MRQANPLITKNHNLPTDPTTVAEELDFYNAMICAEMNWDQYIYEGGAADEPPPKSSLLSQLLQSGGRVAAGVNTIKEWEIAGGNLVPQELAEKRAKVCVACPKNESGDLTSWFTLPAAHLILAQLESRNRMKIWTSSDPLLGVCTACACPLKLKVHCPIDIINDKMRPEDRAQLHPDCWIPKEK